MSDIKIIIDDDINVNLADYAPPRDALEDEEDLLTGEGFKADDDVLCLHNDRNRHWNKHDADKFVKVDSIKDWCIDHANANADVEVVANAIVARVALDTIHGADYEETQKKVADTLRSMIHEIGWSWMFGDIAELLCDEVSEGYAYEMEG